MIIYELTRYVEMHLIKSKIAVDVVLALFNWLICRYDVLEVLVSDNGREFVNKDFEDLAKVLQARYVNTFFHIFRKPTVWLRGETGKFWKHYNVRFVDKTQIRISILIL